MTGNSLTYSVRMKISIEVYCTTELQIPSTSYKFDANLVIPLSKLTWQGKIGEGGCGEVHKVLHQDWGKLAVKKLGVSVLDER